MSRPGRVVVKVGTSALTGGSGGLDESYLDRLVQMLSEVHADGVRVVLVTSGAIAVGVRLLGLDRRPDDLVMSQVAAAVGQGRLMDAYLRAFEARGIVAAQVLLTADVVDHRERYLNARNALNRMLQMGLMPVVNENDTVAVEEICFGDNDRLSALAAALIEADLLVLLSDIPGVCREDPNVNPGAEVIADVEFVDDELRSLCGGSVWGAGGIESKVQAAELAAAAGIPTVVAHAREERVVQRIIGGERFGTRFHPSESGVSARKKWILSRQPAGSITVNAGAARAIIGDGASLLPAGIVDLSGEFVRGEAVALVDADGRRFAVGISEYDSELLGRVMGLKSGQITRVFGEKRPAAAVHRDNLALLGARE